MALCKYSDFVGGPCGPSLENKSVIQCVTIGECMKDVKGHLNHYKVWDASLDSEAKLLLARAGKYIFLFLSFLFYPTILLIF